MKNFKRVLAMVLVVITLVSCFAFSGFAATKKPDVYYPSYYVMTKKTWDDGHYHSYTYDGKGRITKEKWNEPDLEWGGNIGTCDYTYDSNGNLTKKTVKHTDGNYLKWWKYYFKYDKNNNLVKEVYKAVSGYSTTKTFTYDNSGKITKETYKSNDGYKTTCTYNYDKNGNLIKKTEKSSDALTSKYSYKYDKNGYLIKEEFNSPEGSDVATYKYDKNGKLIKKVFKMDDGYTVTDIYTYDNSGRLIKEKQKEGDRVRSATTTTYTYDKKGNLTEESCKFTSGWGTTLSSVAYSYDKNGNLAKSIHKDDFGEEISAVTYKYKKISKPKCSFDVYNYTVSLDKCSFTYSGKAKKPKVTITGDDGNLFPGANFTVSYKNNKKPGKAKAIIKFTDPTISNPITIYYTIKAK